MKRISASVGRAGALVAAAVRTNAAAAAVAAKWPSRTVVALDESGLKGIDVPQWFGIRAPAKTPPAIVDALNREIVRVMALPQIRERFQREAAEPVGNSPAEFGALVRMEVARWSDVARRVGLEPEGSN